MNILLLVKRSPETVALAVSDGQETTRSANSSKREARDDGDAELHSMYQPGALIIFLVQTRAGRVCRA